MDIQKLKQILFNINSTILALNSVEVKGKSNLASIVGSINVLEETFKIMQDELNSINKEAGGD